MRSLIIAVVLVSMSGMPAQAELPSGKAEPTSKDMFSDNGIYIEPGQSHEVTIAGECRLLTNRDPRVAFFITPDRYESWAEVWVRDPREPLFTEKPCE